MTPPSSGDGPGTTPSFPAASVTSGAVLADPVLSTRYRVLETITPGAEDALYLARRLDTGALVDLRVLAGGLGEDRVLVAALVQHATLLARIAAQCPGIAAFNECERTAGGLVVSMAHPEGPTLRQVIKREGTLGLNRAVRLAAALARALERVHKLGLVHGGLCPDNVVLTGPDEDVTLTHFGLDWVLLSRLPEAGRRRGGPQPDLAYRAPEQTWDQATPRSDIYAVGAILYEMLAGAPPPAPTTPGPRVHTEPLRNCRADVSPALERIVTQALLVAPERRPARLAVNLETLTTELRLDRQPTPARDRSTRDGAAGASAKRWLACSGVAVALVMAIWFAHAGVTSAVRPRPLPAPAAVAPGSPVDQRALPMDQPAGPSEQPAVATDESAAPAAALEQPAAPAETASPMDQPAAPVDQPALPMDQPAAPGDRALALPAPPAAPEPGVTDRPADADPTARTAAAPAATTGGAQQAERAPGTDGASKPRSASPPLPAPAPARVAEPPASATPPATRADDVGATTASPALTATDQPDTAEDDPGAIIDWLPSESAGKEH